MYCGEQDWQWVNEGGLTSWLYRICLGIYVYMPWNMHMALLCFVSLWLFHYDETTWALWGLFYLNSSPPGQNGCHFADDSFKCIFFNEKQGFWNCIVLCHMPIKTQKGLRHQLLTTCVLGMHLKISIEWKHQWWDPFPVRWDPYGS